MKRILGSSRVSQVVVVAASSSLLMSGCNLISSSQGESSAKGLKGAAQIAVGSILTTTVLISGFQFVKTGAVQDVNRQIDGKEPDLKQAQQEYQKQTTILGQIGGKDWIPQQQHYLDVDKLSTSEAIQSQIESIQSEGKSPYELDERGYLARDSGRIVVNGSDGLLVFSDEITSFPVRDRVTLKMKGSVVQLAQQNLQSPVDITASDLHQGLESAKEGGVEQTLRALEELVAQVESSGESQNIMTLNEQTRSGEVILHQVDLVYVGDEGRVFVRLQSEADQERHELYLPPEVLRESLDYVARGGVSPADRILLTALAAVQQVPHEPGANHRAEMKTKRYDQMQEVENRRKQYADIKSAIERLNQKSDSIRNHYDITSVATALAGIMAILIYGGEALQNTPKK